MRMLINYIRSCFCKHELDLVKRNEYPSGTTTSYMCKRCGWVRHVRTCQK